jgi:hypothetical protein
MNTFRALAISAALFLIATAVLAQNYRVDWNTLSSGGGTGSSASFRLSCTIAQPAAGFASDVNLLHWIGFWSGDVPTPIVCGSPSAAKLQADGAFVTVAGQIATSAVQDFATFFYVEDSTRVSGLRVDIPPAAVRDLARGSVVNVIGTMSTASNGERQISGPIAIVTGTTTPLTTLGMPCRSIGGASLGVPPLGQFGVTGGRGPNNMGLLIKTWGQVTAVGDGYVTVDDGRGPVRLDTTGLASQPELHSYITVAGISSLYTSGSVYSVIMPRNGTDIKTW